jgi:2-dehydro-3-deoxygluconokinase
LLYGWPYYGLSQKLPPQETVEFATAAAFGKLHEKGDATGQTVEKVYETSKTGSLFMDVT